MSDVSQSVLRELVDKQELQELVIRYCRAVDRADEELLLSCYHPDAFDDHGKFKGNPIDFLAYAKKGAMNPSVGPVQHSITNSVFSIKGDVAYGETYFQARLVTSNGQLNAATGRYVDRYEKRNGAWRIALRRCILEHARDATSNLADFVQGARNRTDPSYEGL